MKPSDKYEMTEEKRSKFTRFVERQRARRYIRYVYARETVPPNAVGVVIRDGNRWWFVTPAFPYEPGNWRVSYGDELGPAGRDADGWTSKYDAILYALGYGRRRITEYVLRSGEHVFVGRQRAAQPNPRVYGGRG